jgi:hypothetical protein
LGLVEVSMRQRLLVALVVSLAASVPASAEGPAIEHQPLGCTVAGRFPRLLARVASAESIARARVQFQPQGGRHWYGVDMTAQGAVFTGVLPKPKKSLASYRYYIEVTDAALGTTRTPEYTTTVARGAGACADATRAEGLASAMVKLQAPPGAPAVPGGFSATGVVASGTGAAVAGAAVAAGATTAVAAGGGISAAALVIGGVAVAGAGAAVAVTSGRSSGSNEGQNTDTSATYSGPYNGQFVLVMHYPGNDCTATHTLSGTATIRLDQATGPVTGTLSVNGTDSRTADTCLSPTLLSVSPTWGAPISGTAAALEARMQQGPTIDNGVAVTTTTNVYAFTGALSGGVITGTIVITASGDGRPPAGQSSPRPFTWDGSATIPVTVR